MTDLTFEQARSTFIWGGVGGALPTIAKIAGTFGANFEAPIPHVFGVTIAIVLYAVIGAIVARAMGNAEMKHSLFAGIAAPAIVVSVIAGVSDSRSLRIDQSRQSKSGIVFISSAFAQSPADMGMTTGSKGPETLRKFNVEVTSRSNYPIDGDVAIYANINGAKKEVSKLSVDVGAVTKTTIQIPQNTTELSFISPSGVQAVVPVTGKSEMQLMVIPKTSSLKDFFWALGGQRSVAIGELKASFPPQK